MCRRRTSGRWNSSYNDSRLGSPGVPRDASAGTFQQWVCERSACRMTAVGMPATGSQLLGSEFEHKATMHFHLPHDLIERGHDLLLHPKGAMLGAPRRFWHVAVLVG